MLVMYVDRELHLPEILKEKSVFLFGARSTGKSALIRKTLPGLKVLDLLSSELYLRLSAAPESLESMVKNTDEVVVIDEVQRIPALLNEVHRLIEGKGVRFLLTGSSARKLRRGGANLLAGRAWTFSLFPLTFWELQRHGVELDLDRYLRYGGLPNVYLSKHPIEELHAYVGTYLKEEVQIEAGVRNLPGFSRFLKTAALTNGEMLKYASIASDAAVPASTVKDHYTILEDTLVGFTLPSWKQSRKRKAISSAKFYFFDLGVTHTLASTKTIERNSDLYGKSFEHFMAMELRAFLSYRRIFDELCYWRSTAGHEVDFLIGDHTAIEVKATSRVTKKHRKGLLALKEEGIFGRYIIVSQDNVESTDDGVEVWHWRKFLEALWQGRIIG